MMMILPWSTTRLDGCGRPQRDALRRHRTAAGSQPSQHVSCGGTTRFDGFCEARTQIETRVTLKAGWCLRVAFSALSRPGQ